MTSNRVLGMLLAAAVVCGLMSCGNSRQERLENNLKEAISVYMSENLPADVSVDSIVVLHIDSLSDYSYLLFVEKPVAENYAEQLNLEYNSYPEDGDVKVLEQRQRVADKITGVVSRLEALDRELSDPRTDSTNLKCFFAAVRIYMKKGNQVLEPEYYGFPVTPDFRVLESEAIPE
ncbi:MAG: hypothetical protein IIU04_08770 [Bacteroidales bacterium]|nr:hypothetical protein [Bacteroidales bacterium]